MRAIYTCAAASYVRACVRLHLYHGPPPPRRCKVFARFIEKTSPSPRRRRRLDSSSEYLNGRTRRGMTINNNTTEEGKKVNGTERTKNHYAGPTAAGTRDRISMYFYDGRAVVGHGTLDRPPVPILKLRSGRPVPSSFPHLCTCVVIFVSPRPRAHDPSVPRNQCPSATRGYHIHTSRDGPRTRRSNYCNSYMIIKYDDTVHSLCRVTIFRKQIYGTMFNPLPLVNIGK